MNRFSVSRIGLKGLLGSVLLAICSPLYAQDPSAPPPPAPPAPCLEEPHFGDFDFWVGHWRVETASGQFAGVNTISKAQNGCLLLEDWRGARGSTGASMNYYDVNSKDWVQVWAGAGGSQIHIRGGLHNGSMLLVGHIIYVGQGGKADFRGTWTPLDDGRVRQFFEQSNDGGVTWQPWFDGYYSRVAPATAGNQ